MLDQRHLGRSPEKLSLRGGFVYIIKPEVSKIFAQWSPLTRGNHSGFFLAMQWSGFFKAWFHKFFATVAFLKVSHAFLNYKHFPPLLYTLEDLKMFHSYVCIFWCHLFRIPSIVHIFPLFFSWNNVYIVTLWAFFEALFVLNLLYKDPDLAENHHSCKNYTVTHNSGNILTFPKKSKKCLIHLKLQTLQVLKKLWVKKKFCEGWTHERTDVLVQIVI